MSEELTQTTTCDAREDALTVRPAYRTSEAEEGISLEVALPGVRKEDLRITFQEGILTIDAARNYAVPEGWKALQDPVRPDRYRLRVRLHSSLDPARTTANLADGLLRLSVAKRKEALPQRIEIN